MKKSALYHLLFIIATNEIATVTFRPYNMVIRCNRHKPVPQPKMNTTAMGRRTNTQVFCGDWCWPRSSLVSFGYPQHWNWTLAMASIATATSELSHIDLQPSSLPNFPHLMLSKECCHKPALRGIMIPACTSLRDHQWLSRTNNPGFTHLRWFRERKVELIVELLAGKTFCNSQLWRVATDEASAAGGLHAARQGLRTALDLCHS